MADTDTLDALRVLIALGDFTPPPDAHPDGLILDSDSIGTKFGFNDGDEPDTVVNMVATHLGHYHYIGRMWHPILMDLVQAYLVPAINRPDLDIYLLSTIHNPIRFATTPTRPLPAINVYVPWLDVLTRVIHQINLDLAATANQPRNIHTCVGCRPTR